MRNKIAAEQGYTLIELMVVLAIVMILLTIAIGSYLAFKDRANEAAAGGDVRAILPAIEAYHGDNSTYVGMTAAGLKAGYDAGIVPSRYTITSLTASSYCVSAQSGGKSWKKDGPGGAIVAGSCP